MKTEEIQKMRLQFKRRVLVLISIEKKLEELISKKEIKEKKIKEIKEKISIAWDKTYNQHPLIPKSIKQGFNLLYTQSSKI